MTSSLRVSRDKYVQFTYQITSLDGEVLERVDFPLVTIVGRHNRLYQRVEDAMLGAGMGDEVSVELPPQETAWGEADPELIIKDSVYNVPQEFRRLGAEVQFQNDQGGVKTFTVTHLDKEHITIDGNHPLAGKVVQFHVTIKAIRAATGQELVEGVASGVDELGLSSSPTLH